jgi:succinoglycan biosynthesis transport protein ExoP
VGEAYRSLATSLQFSSETGLPRTIVVTSAEAQEGKSSTSVALARHFAVTGKRVLIIDADLRRPSLHIKLGQNNAVGLTNCLTGMTTLPEVVQPTEIPNLWFMASGPLPPNAADILAGTHVFSLISLGLETYDLIIFDSPPMLGLADAQLLGAAASATVVVVGAGDARRSILRGALRRLQMARAQTIGLVLTKFNASTSGYGYGYGYSGGYDPVEEQAESARPAKKWMLPGFNRGEYKSNTSEMV